MSFRDAYPVFTDLLMPNGHSLVHSLTDDLPSNGSCSQAVSWLDRAAQSSAVSVFKGEPLSGHWGVVVHFMAVVCRGFSICGCVCTFSCLCIPYYNLIYEMTAALLLALR